MPQRIQLPPVEVKQSKTLYNPSKLEHLSSPSRCSDTTAQEWRHGWWVNWTVGGKNGSRGPWCPEHLGGLPVDAKGLVCVCMCLLVLVLSAMCTCRTCMQLDQTLLSVLHPILPGNGKQLSPSCCHFKEHLHLRLLCKCDAPDVLTGRSKSTEQWVCRVPRSQIGRDNHTKSSS